MSQETEIVVVHSDRAGCDQIADEISRIPEAETRVTEKHNLDGSPAGWFVVAVVAVKTLPAILDAVGRLIQLYRVKSIKIGEIEMENPSRADVDDIKQKYLKRIRPHPND